MVSSIKTRAEALGYAFVYGVDSFKNYLGDKSAVSKAILLDPVTVNVNIDDNRITTSENLYSTTVAICSHGKVYETYQDKYFARLEALKVELITFLIALQCNDAFIFQSISISEFINKYDNNFDGLSATITYKVYG